MREILNNIREKTKGMNRHDKADYILTYYWYHMLIIFSALLRIPETYEMARELADYIENLGIFDR